MQTVAHSHESSQTMTLPDRVRRQVALRLVPQIAALLYKADKGNEHADLTDLRSDGARGVYLADALLILDPDQQMERRKRVHAQDAHVFAAATDEGETVNRQAREDVARFDGAARFGSVAPNACAICKTPIIGVPCSLMVSEHLKQNIHVRCAIGLVGQGKARRLSTLQFVAVSESGGQQ